MRQGRFAHLLLCVGEAYDTLALGTGFVVVITNH